MGMWRGATYYLVGAVESRRVGYIGVFGCVEGACAVRSAYKLREGWTCVLWIVWRAKGG